VKIGLIHLTQRVDSWGFYWAWELRRRGHEVVYLPEEVGPFPEAAWREIACDVFVRIDDSQSFDTPDWCRPLIYLCSDTHVSDGVKRHKIAFEADHTFFCQKNAKSIQYGTGQYEWMPHAAWFFPERQKVLSLDVCSFMVLGEDIHPIFGERSRLARRLDDILNERLTHDTPESLREFKTKIRGGVFHQEMAAEYARAHIVWHHSVGNDIAMRHFEGAACGACVVSSRIVDNGMEIFGDLIPQYDTSDECIDLIRSLLAKPDECAERGRELRKLVEGRHRYAHRVDRVLAKAEELVG